MVDIVSTETRSRMMAGIRGRDTRPEMIIRSGLHRRGFRFSLHAGGLPGRPDLVFTRYKAVILVQGCFWHGHDCHLFKWPSTRPEFWREKITGNVLRDRRAYLELRDLGWRACEVWECTLKGRERQPVSDVLDACVEFLNSENLYASIGGQSRIVTCVPESIPPRGT